jgi:hypothetical protein
MKKVWAKMVHKNPTNDQRQQREASNESRGMKNSWIESSLGMKSAVSSMILTQSSKACNGTVRSTDVKIKNQHNSTSFSDCIGTVRRFSPIWTDCYQRFYLKGSDRVRQGSSREAKIFPDKSVLHHDKWPTYTTLSVNNSWETKLHFGPGTLRWKSTDVSEEHVASIYRVEYVM